jgi:hypothetical protein
MSSTTDSILDDEQLILEEYRAAKKCGYADIEISVHRGELAKVWVTSKRSGDDLKATRKLKEGESVQAV